MQRLNRTTMALIAGAVVLVLAFAYFLTSRNPDQDKLTNRPLSTGSAPAPEKACASSATYDLIKRELFRRAAQLRGSDQAAFDKMSGYAVVRMENPVMVSQDKSTGAVNCSGSLSLDLPPGVAIVGGRRTLSSDVDYTVTAAADGSGQVVLLRNADTIVAPLATLARVEQPPAPPVTSPENNQAVLEPGPSQPEPQQQAQPAPTPSQQQTQPSPIPPPSTPALPRPAAARPSFSCEGARTRGEVAVCSNAGLAALDRQMAAEYSRAYAAAPPDQRALLRDTAHRFYAFRDRCSTTACVGDAYSGRMREIRDIMEGRWQPPR